MLNKKGTTLIELIVTITLISLILLVLFKIILTVNSDSLSATDIEILSIKNVVTKKIEDEWIKNGNPNNITIKSNIENKTQGIGDDYQLPTNYFYLWNNPEKDLENHIYIQKIYICQKKDLNGATNENNCDIDPRYTIKLYYYDENYNG